MPSSQAHSGIPLPPEIVLVVIENMDYEPKMLATLMCVSKELASLIKDNEASLSTYFARPFKPSFAPLCASSIRLSHRLLQPRTFPWLAEYHFRASLLKDLLKDGFGGDMHHVYRETSFCKACFDKAVGEKGFLALHLLYQVFDAKDREMSRFEAQMYCISELSAADLAHLRLLTHNLSATYARNKVDEIESENRGDYNFAVMDVDCVVREMLIRQGPYFIWAGLHGTTAEQKMVQKCIDEGIVQLRQYEDPDSRLVYKISNHSIVSNLMQEGLQSYILGEFCRKVKCELNGSRQKMIETAVDDFIDTYSSIVHVKGVSTSA